MIDDILDGISSLFGKKAANDEVACSYTPIDGVDTKQFEGLRLHVYKDSVGKKTIGYGHNLQGGNNQNIVKLGLSPSSLLEGTLSLTKKQADDLFDLDYSDSKDSVATLIPDIDSMPPLVQNVLVDLCFNMGLGTLSTFHRTLNAFNAKEWGIAANCLQQSLWYRQVGNRSRIICQALRNI